MADFNVAASWATEPYFFRAPHPPTQTPMPFQLAGVEYALARNHALIGDVPGLGKTIQGILLSNAIEARRTLVISPASLRLNWEREIWKWSTVENVETYPVLKSADGVSNTAHYVILSYALLANPAIRDAVLDIKWDHVICDEAHAVKDPKGNTRTKIICAPDMLPSVAGRFTFLSGTIMPNQPIEVYNAARLLNWEAIDRMSLEAFREYYYDLGGGMIRGPVFDPTSQTWSNKLHWSEKVRNVPRNLDELQRRLRKSFMVRRTKELVLPQLPRVRWMPVPLVATAAIRKALKHPGWAEAEKLYALDADAFDHGVPVDGHIASARRELGEAKAEAIADYIFDLVASGVDKVLVSAWHHSVLGYLREKLTPLGLVFMDGATSSRRKQAVVDQFQTDPKIKVILGQTAVIGEGWTLTRAQDIVLAEPDWVPGRNQQVVDRLHRIGQKGLYVVAHIPVVPGTLDERILGVAVAKDRSIYQALDKPEAA